MSEIKYTLGLLSKLLNLLLETKVEPEHFRLAKFDKGTKNVVAILWFILGKLTNNTYTNIPSIKYYMTSLKYPRENFQNLPENMSKGSKEVLLAISFILNEKIDDFVKVEIENCPLNPDYDFLGVNDDICDDEEKVVLSHLTSENDCKQYLMWVKGKLGQSVKQIEEYDVQNKTLVDKLKTDLPLKFEDLSLNRLIAFISKKYCKQFIEKTDRIFEILEQYVLWKRKEDIFWKWMKTVLEQKN
ncbi:unnamed protein product [Brassicogethes aeneus]|uniref:Tubulin epsilon and delta complex protein 1 domain-containing protein n=1 Tax=Brassicogethes aeneus TaxID=1431903 RepID=A0A9P0AXB3_BRAAE|nr:unnamed protein product [Brassicogethes aeneus]